MRAGGEGDGDLESRIWGGGGWGGTLSPGLGRDSVCHLPLQPQIRVRGQQVGTAQGRTPLVLTLGFWDRILQEGPGQAPWRQGSEGSRQVLSSSSAGLWPIAVALPGPASARLSQVWGGGRGGRGISILSQFQFCLQRGLGLNSSWIPRCSKGHRPSRRAQCFFAWAESALS